MNGIKKSLKIALTLLWVAWGFVPQGVAEPALSWRDPYYRKELKNEALAAQLQSGFLVRLTDRKSGRDLVSIDPSEIPSSLPLFGDQSVTLDDFEVHMRASGESVLTRFEAPDRTQWDISWTIEPGSGDLIANSRASAPDPVGELRMFFLGCDIAEHAVIWVGGYGVGRHFRAPWSGAPIGDPVGPVSPQSFVHPLVSLFQAGREGWFIEGREERIGPACLMIGGKGGTVNLAYVRRFPIPTNRPRLYEIRIRAYRDQWEDAVDPYVAWMEEGAGFVPLENQKPDWIKEIKTQAYVRVGDFETLDSLAKEVDPSKTLIGRMVGFRHYAMDTHYPDYELTDTARKWFRHARDLGFHAGAHFNSKNISSIFPELVERFRPGLRVEGVDEHGNEIYESIHNGTLLRCSAAFKPWRDYLIEQMQDAVESGVDVIYLDESMAPNGKFLVDGVNGIEGIMLLMQEVRAAYPDVAIETEQFNPLANRHAAFALSQMPPGHPLSGYIFRRFVKVVPEGWMYMPTEEHLMDAFDSWGYMLPGADPLHEKPWMHIARAFQEHDLVPDSRLPRVAAPKYVDHYSHGTMPDLGSPPAGEVLKLFGYRGKNGTTAYFEKHPTRRGLMIYEPGKEPAWAGAWHYGIDSWPALVEPEYSEVPGKLISYWLIYDDEKLLGLNPKLTYSFTSGTTVPPGRFHLSAIPPDFAHHSSMDRRILSQEMGNSLDYFKVFFSGTGRLEMFVPDEYDVYLDGEKLLVDREARQAVADASAPPSDPSVIMAFRRLDLPLTGPWLDFPLQARPYYTGYIDRDESVGFHSAVTGIGIIIGRLPEAKRIRLLGSYEVMRESIGDGNQGTLRMNGKELWRAPVEKPPFAKHEFDIDVSTLAGEYVMLEFAVEGEIHAWWRATWADPRVVVEN